ncbi:membrane-spanning 4-domains subfamily A member 18-like isoform X2 [Silurus meridionalis]|uniref:membrane-spanning 4-domains subfamily A member 18-like isoform X2 n=1 Tax=Silurus meridionalis TaxID=175797 RepID=UPI001EEB3707|nr:membrane-spanning 4-domains subfamily A member 18-like isoform X2 [Silurus meridionalis]
MAAVGQSLPVSVNVVNAQSSTILHFLKAQPKALGVKGSLGMNVVSAVFSAVGIGVLTGDFFLYYYCNQYSCSMFEARSKAISAVLLVFAILQFIISITISAFGCKATCCSEPMMPTVIYSNQAAPGNLQVPVVMYPNQAAPGNPQVPIVTYSTQSALSNPHNVMYIPQVQVNNSTPAAQNLYEDLHHK